MSKYSKRSESKMFEKVVTVLGAKRLDFDNAGDVVRGVQVWYYTDPVSEIDIVGCIPAKAWLKDIKSFDVFLNRQYPCEARVVFDIDISKNKLIPKVFDFDTPKK